MNQTTRKVSEIKRKLQLLSQEPSCGGTKAQVLIVDIMRDVLAIEAAVSDNVEVTFESLRDQLDENQLIEAALEYVECKDDQPLLSGFESWIKRAQLKED